MRLTFYKNAYNVFVTVSKWIKMCQKIWQTSRMCLYAVKSIPLLDEPRHVILPISHFCLKLCNFFLQGVLNLELGDFPSIYIRQSTAFCHIKRKATYLGNWLDIWTLHHVSTFRCSAAEVSYCGSFPCRTNVAVWDCSKHLFGTREFPLLLKQY